MSDNVIKFNFLGEEIECKLWVTEYQNNGTLAIMLMSKDEEGNYEIWSDLTTNLPFSHLEKPYANVNLKGYSDLVGIIKKYKLAKNMDENVSSGYNIYGTFKFNMKEVKKYEIEIEENE